MNKPSLPKLLKPSEKLNLSDYAFVQRHALTLFANFIQNYNGADIGRSKTFAILQGIAAPEKIQRAFGHFFTAQELTHWHNKRSESAPLRFIDDIEELFSLAWLRSAARPRITKIIVLLIRSFLRQQPSADGENIFARRLAEARETMRLSELETDILSVLYCLSQDVLAVDNSHRLHEKINFVAKCLNVSVSAVRQAFSPERPLKNFGCIDSDGDLNPQMIEFLNGIDNTPLAHRYYHKFDGAALPLTHFGDLMNKDADGDLVRRLLANRSADRSAHILLYGAPGTGKTSFARSLATSLGLDCYTIIQGKTGADAETTFRQTNALRLGALRLCVQRVDVARSLLIIDEADNVLGGDKGMLNQALDVVNAAVIWIANADAADIDPSSRRRFDYSVKFGKLTDRQRLAVWQNAVAREKLEPLFDGDYLAEASRRYTVSAGGIAVALRTVPLLAADKTEVPLLVDKVLRRHCELLDLPTDRERQQLEPAKNYSLDGLNISGDLPLARIVSAIRKFQQQAAAGDAAPDAPRMNLLLAGPPGTGKTEFVKYLGKTLETPIIVKTAGDLLSKWVGETEKNIKEAFAEAKKERAILFLDELDSFLQSREKAQRSWEVSQVNELLQHLENFGGIMVGATNFAKNLDAAVLRRFTFKLEFDWLDRAGKKIFFEKMFPTPLTVSEAARLADIPGLAPGDFRTVRQSLYYLDTEVSNSVRLDALERESGAKAKNGFAQRKKIGF